MPAETYLGKIVEAETTSEISTVNKENIVEQGTMGHTPPHLKVRCFAGLVRIKMTWMNTFKKNVKISQ